MKKHYLKLLFMFVFSVCANAQEFNDISSTSVIDDANSPETIADSIVIYEPSMDMPLDEQGVERIIEGKIIKVEKGLEPNLIIHNASSFHTPLQNGVQIKLFLKQFQDRDAYYPIAIFPATSETTESLEDFQHKESPVSVIPAISLSENVTGLWQDENNEKSYYSFHQSDNTIIIIDLLNLESSGKTFSATYVGSIQDYILKPILPGLPINVEFQSDTEATMIPICEVCSVVITQLKKVF